MDGVQLSQDYTATSRIQFTFHNSVPKISWYSLNRPREDEQLSQARSHSVILNLELLDWESSALTKKHEMILCLLALFLRLERFMEKLCTAHLALIAFIVRDIISVSDIFSIFPLAEVIKFVVYLNKCH